MTIPKRATKPNCNNNRRGNIIYDTAAGHFFGCTALGWRRLALDDHLRSFNIKSGVAINDTVGTLPFFEADRQFTTFPRPGTPSQTRFWSGLYATNRSPNPAVTDNNSRRQAQVWCETQHAVAPRYLTQLGSIVLVVNRETTSGELMWYFSDWAGNRTLGNDATVGEGLSLNPDPRRLFFSITCTSFTVAN